MLNRAAPPQALTDGRTASNGSLNGAKCWLPVAKPWIGGGPGCSRASQVLWAKLFFPSEGWIDQPSGKCRLK